MAIIDVQVHCYERDKPERPWAAVLAGPPEGIRTGRIVTVGMNVRTRMLAIANFIQAHVYDEKIPASFIKESTKLKDRIETLEESRNKFVHGLWDKQNGQWRVLRMTAARPIPALSPNIKRLYRSVLPNSEPVTAQTLQDVASAIIAVSRDVEALCRRLEGALAPLQHKSPQYTRRRYSPQARKKKTPHTPRKSFRASPR